MWINSTLVHMDLSNLASITDIWYVLTGGAMGFPTGSNPAACLVSAKTAAGKSNSNNIFVGVFLLRGIRPS
jgi:hypothetical protein